MRTQLPGTGALLLTLAAGCHGAAPAKPPADRPDDAELPAKTVAALTAECMDKGNAPVCLLLSGAFRAGALGFSRNDAAAERMMEQAVAGSRAGCERGDAEKCAFLGMWILVGAERRGAGTPEARHLAETAAPLLDKACSGGEGDACELAGNLYRDGAYLPRDARRAAAFYERACKAKDAQGCLGMAALLLGGAPGVPVDAARAVEAAERGCAEKDAKSCTWLGVCFARGEGVPVDLTRAAALFERACAGGDAEGCDDLARVKQPTPAPSR
jgi:TPR repeat protein